MNIIDELKWRDLIYDVSDKNKIAEWAKNKGGVYIGVDPSAKSMHLGNYQAYHITKMLRNYGHPVIIIVGGITGLVGDPRDPKLSKDSILERNNKDKKEIEANLKSIEKQVKQIFGIDKVLNNAEFYKDMSIGDYLRDIGKLVNVNYLLEKDVIARRLETGISYAEFSYTLLQGYDFLYLYQNHNIECQFGGQDQWGNVTTGLEMIRKVVGSDNKACCFSVPLLLKDDGTKFGKSESGTIWLDRTLTSPYVMYQFLLNQSDEMIETLLKRLTYLSKDEIKEIMKNHKKEPSKRVAQKELANNIVRDVHGENELKKALKITDAFFNNKLENLESDELLEGLGDKNNFLSPHGKINILDLLLETKMVKSKGEGRKIIEQKGISINGKIIESIDFNVEKKDSINNSFSYIKKGKKEYCLVKFK